MSFIELNRGQRISEVRITRHISLDIPANVLLKFNYFNRFELEPLLMDHVTAVQQRKESVLDYIKYH